MNFMNKFLQTIRLFFSDLFMGNEYPQLPMAPITPVFETTGANKISIKADGTSKISNVNANSKGVSASVRGKNSVSFSGSTGLIVINGVSYHGKSVSVINGKVIIDGVEQPSTSKNDKKISISIEGNIDSLSVDECESLIQTGSVKDLHTLSGDVRVNGDVGSISSTSGDVEVSGNINGPVSTMSGDVDAKQIHGKVNTLSGDIKYVSR